MAEGTDLVIEITNTPEVSSNYFGISICSRVLNRVKEDNKALTELYRALKPGGQARLAGCAPSRLSCTVASGDHDHDRWYAVGVIHFDVDDDSARIWTCSHYRSLDEDGRKVHGSIGMHNQNQSHPAGNLPFAQDYK
jgi:SAM-dependent methyltransferase